MRVSKNSRRPSAACAGETASGAANEAKRALARARRSLGSPAELPEPGGAVDVAAVDAASFEAVGSGLGSVCRQATVPITHPNTSEQGTPR